MFPQQAKCHRLVQRQARDPVALALRESQCDETAVRVADKVDAGRQCGDPVEVRRDKRNFIVQREHCRRGRDRIVAITAKVNRNRAKTPGQSLGKRYPLRLRAQ